MLALGAAAAQAKSTQPTFGADYVSTTIAGGGQFVIHSHGTGDLVYSGHEGTTHFDRTYTTTPGSSCDLRTMTGFLCSYDNQSTSWVSVQSGRMRVVHEDGTEVELGPGEAYVIEPGHDASVVGDERFVAFEFESRAAEEYARE